MDMVDMKMDKSESASPVEVAKCCDKLSGSQYPYGLEIRLEKDSLDKLELEDCEVGDFYMVIAKCKVTSTNESERENGDDSKCVTLQIVKMNVKDMPDMNDSEDVSKEDRQKKNLDDAEEIMTGKKGY